MILFDYNVKVEYGKQHTGLENGITIRNNTRNLYLKSLNFIDHLEILISLLYAYKSCSSTALHRYNSFSPIREKVSCRWFIDG
jgi:hypothetical protein